MRGSVTKKRNRWYIYYYTGKDKAGKWQRKWEGSWETKREAERALRSRIEEVESTFDRKAEKSTVAVYLRHWLKTYCTQHLAANTIRGYQVNIENHIIPGIGDTNATLMLRNAVPAKIVSAMLGHSSIGITMDTYSHVITEMQEGAAGVMDSLLEGSW